MKIEELYQLYGEHKLEEIKAINRYKLYRLLYTRKFFNNGIESTINGGCFVDFFMKTPDEDFIHVMPDKFHEAVLKHMMEIK